jgi:hypothetical protein
MPNLLDSLFFQVGWDTRDFDRGRKQVEKDFSQTKDNAHSAANEIEASGKRAASFFRTLRNETVGLFLAFQGASSLKGLVVDLINGAASTDRLAKNMGVARNELFAWQNLIKTVGGNATDATSALQSMAGAIQGWRISGTTGNDQAFAALGVTSADFTTPDNLLKKIADASQRMDRPQFAARVSALGFSPEMIELLSKGRGELEKQLEVQKQLATITDEDVKSANEFQKAWALASTTLTGLVRPALTEILKSLVGLIEATQRFAKANPVFVSWLERIGIVAGNILNPVRLLTIAMAAMWKAANGDVSGAVSDLNSAFNPFSKGGAPSAGGGAPTGGEGGSGAPAGAGGSVSGLFNVLAAKYGNDRARGIWAGIGAESRWDPNAVNPTSGAYGLGQWLGARKKGLFAKYGKAPSAAQQLEYLMSEIDGGDSGGSSVRGSNSASSALYNYVVKFMRPGDGAAGDLRRGSAILGTPRTYAPSGGGGGGNSTTIGTIVINTAATNADGIAKDLPTKLRERGLVVQANSSVSQ